MEEGSLGSALQATKPGQEGKAPRFPALWARLRPLSSTTELKPDLDAPPAEAEADYVEASKETDTYYHFFRLRFRSPSLQACFQLHKQAQNKYLFKFRVSVMALLCGPLWLLHLPASSAFEKSQPLFQASFLAWLLVFELPLICSLFLYLWQERDPAAQASKRIESSRFWLEQIGQVGGALTAAFLLLGRSFGQAGLTPCPFPAEKFHLQIFVASPCNPGAVAGLVPFLETAILLIIPVFFSTISSLARPTLLLLLLIVYGAVCASMVSLSIRTGVQPENILFFIFSLTWIFPILSYEAQLATNFMHVVGKTRVVVNLYKNFCSLKQSAKYDQACQQMERQQQWEEALQRAYQVVSEQIFRDLRSKNSAPSSGRESPRALTSPNVLIQLPDLNTDGGLAELPQQDKLTTHDAIDRAPHPLVQNDRFLPPDYCSGHSVSLSNETQFRAKQAEMKTNMGKLTSNNNNNNNNKSFLRGQLLGKEAMTKENMNDSNSSAEKATEDMSSLNVNNLAEQKREYPVTPQSELMRIQERVYGRDESVCLVLTRDLCTAGPRDCTMSSTGDAQSPRTSDALPCQRTPT